MDHSYYVMDQTIIARISWSQCL